jgi:hypothetical protein
MVASSYCWERRCSLEPLLMFGRSCLQGDCSEPPPAAALTKFSKGGELTVTPFKVDTVEFKEGQCMLLLSDTLIKGAGKLWLHNLFLASNVQSEADGPEDQLRFEEGYLTNCTLHAEENAALTVSAPKNLYMEGVWLAIACRLLVRRRALQGCVRGEPRHNLAL